MAYQVLRILFLFFALLLTETLPATAQSGKLTLQPGDVVKVAIWREEGLSGEFPINEDGLVTLPLLGEKEVTGIPIADLRRVLVEEYRVHLRNPSIEITPLRRVHILGQVNEPGLYKVDPTISLAGAVAMAGGTNYNGNLDNIRIVRDGAVIRQRVSPGATLDVVDVRSGDQIFIMHGSWISRNYPFLVSTMVSLTYLMMAVLR